MNLEDRTMETMESEKQKEETEEKQHLWAYQHTHHGTSRKSKGQREYLKIMAKNVPNLRKDMNINIQEGQRILRWTQRDPHGDTL